MTSSGDHAPFRPARSMFDITFYGVRGSTPCSGPSVARYGGNTSCVLVQVPAEPPIVCDLGTGLRYLGEDHGKDRPFVGTALVSHLHWDHIQGLPFFAPALKADSKMEIIGPIQETHSLGEAFANGLTPPLFPVELADLPGRFTFREASSGCFEVGSADVTAFPVTHVGPTNGYRIDRGRASVAYISDFQQPEDGSLGLSKTVVEVCRGVDVLIHDAQYDPPEFATKSNWGHCTVQYAVEVAVACEARRLVLFHHDPSHDDEWVDRARDQAAELAGSACEVIAASEGLTLSSGD